MELFEAKWTEVPARSDGVNLEFVREIVGRARVAQATVLCRAPTSYPLEGGLRVGSVLELD